LARPALYSDSTSFFVYDLSTQSSVVVFFSRAPFACAFAYPSVDPPIFRRSELEVHPRTDLDAICLPPCRMSTDSLLSIVALFDNEEAIGSYAMILVSMSALKAYLVSNNSRPGRIIRWEQWCQLAVDTAIDESGDESWHRGQLTSEMRTAIAHTSRGLRGPVRRPRTRITGAPSVRAPWTRRFWCS